MSEEAIRIECPGCHRKFRLRARGPSGRNAVKCPKCGTKIPLENPRQQQHVDEATKPAQKTDDDLRRMLQKAKKKRTTDLTEAPADVTRPDLPVDPDDTAPDHGVTMPMGRGAMRAESLGTDQAGVGALRRKRRDTPRAGALAAPALKPPTPPASIERPVVDEPTYTGPMPGRTPHITPSGSDLSRFLEPGNYFVRVEDVVYAPVSEKELAKLLNVGVFFAIDELSPEDGEWIPIASPELFSDLKARLAHRAHHMLARVVPGKPASSYDRPGKDAPPPVAEELTAPSLVALQAAPVAPPVEPTPAVEPVATPAVAPKRRRIWPWLLALPLMFAGTGAALFVFVPDLPQQVRGLLAREDVPPPVEDVGVALSVLAEEDAGEIDPEPAFQSATAAVLSAHAVADSIDGQLRAAQELGEDEAAIALLFAKWQRDPIHGNAGELLASLRKSGRLSAARKVANWRLATDDSAPKELREFVTDSLRSEIEAQAPIKVTTDEFARFVRVDPGHRPAIVVQDVHGTRWTIWPDMGPDDWHNDIAVYRLCELMVCQFDVPKTHVMQIDKKSFKALTKAADDTTKEMANRLRPDFDWTKKGMLVGSMRPVPTGVPWPVELSQIWRPWLTAGSGLAQLDDDVEEAHQTIAFFGAERVYPEVRGMKGRDLARQVSALMLVDYLVNNWNRFAPTEENWGTRTRIDAGLVHSVEDSAAFLGDNSVRVNGRFSWSKRFSRATVESLRSLKPDQANDLLFPNPTKEDKEKLENLWAQRSRALRRINKLVKRYGAEDVFALDVDQNKDPK